MDARVRPLPSLAGLRSPQLTDIYLLGLAVQRKGHFATFDTRVPAEIIPGGPAALVLIPTS